MSYIANFMPQPLHPRGKFQSTSGPKAGLGAAKRKISAYAFNRTQIPR
jgi:hypothetical protein